MRILIFILLFVSPCFAQCDSSDVAKDSAIAALRTENAVLSMSLWSQRERYADAIRFHAATDSVYERRIVDHELFEHFNQLREDAQRPRTLAIGILAGVVLSLTTLLLLKH
ncbi:MAG: hypothetical protein JSS75_07105 [Bacteroidetes bacterium]|nr:hypothetical protein [Bacteroidota bacterium]